MKKKSLLFIFLMIHLSVLSQGIDFIESMDSWEAVVQKSKTENKPIFVDVYTEWCGPCKWMDQNVFNQAEVGENMNTAFINVKVDAEKGWGKDFAQQFRISGYPTFLYFNPQGQVVMTAMGSKPTDRFIAESQQALKFVRSGTTSSSISYQAFHNLIINNQLSSDKILEFFSVVDKSDPQIPYYLELFLDQLPPDSLFQTSTAVMINSVLSAPIVPSSKAFKTLIEINKKRPIYAAILMGPWITLTNLFQNTSDIAGAEINDALLSDVLRLQDTLYQDPEMANLFKSYYETRYFAQKGYYPEFIEQFEAFLIDHFFLSNWKRLAEMDQSHFRVSLELTHGTVDPLKIGKEKYELAGGVHFSMFRLLFTHLKALTIIYKEQFPEEFEKYDKKHMVNAMELVNEHYKKNPVHVSSNLVNSNQRYIDRYKIQ